MMKKMMKKKLVLLAFAMCMFAVNLTAQNSARYQALFIYNFTRYIEWPAFDSQEFVIGVLGNSEIRNELQTITNGKKVGLKNITIKKFLTPEEISNCQILFVSDEISSTVSAFSSSLQNKNTLIITERPGLINKGSGINFVINDGKQKFELSRVALNKTGLKVNNQLIDMAILTN